MARGMRWDKVRSDNAMRSRGAEEIHGPKDRSQVRIVNRLEPRPPKQPAFRREPPEAAVVAKHAVCIHESQKAILVAHTGTQEWFPKRIIHPYSQVRKKGDKGRLAVISRWLDRAPPDKLCSDPS